MQNTHAGTSFPPGPAIMPDGRLVVRERSMGRFWSRVGFDSLDKDKLKFGLNILSIEKAIFLDKGEVDDDDISEENEE